VSCQFTRLAADRAGRATLPAGMTWTPQKVNTAAGNFRQFPTAKASRCVKIGFQRENQKAHFTLFLQGILAFL
jgi:hypothetical protein